MIDEELLNKQLDSVLKRDKKNCYKMPPEFLKLFDPNDWDGIIHIYRGGSICLCGKTEFLKN